MNKPDQEKLIKDTMTKELRKMRLKIIITCICMYIGIVCTIMRFYHPEYTETELFLSIPKAIILNFK